MHDTTQTTTREPRWYPLGMPWFLFKKKIGRVSVFSFAYILTRSTVWAAEKTTKQSQHYYDLLFSLRGSKSPVPHPLPRVVWRRPPCIGDIIFLTRPGPARDRTRKCEGQLLSSSCSIFETTKKKKVREIVISIEGLWRSTVNSMWTWPLVTSVSRGANTPLVKPLGIHL